MAPLAKVDFYNDWRGPTPHQKSKCNLTGIQMRFCSITQWKTWSNLIICLLGCTWNPFEFDHTSLLSMLWTSLSGDGKTSQPVQKMSALHQQNLKNFIVESENNKSDAYFEEQLCISPTWLILTKKKFKSSFFLFQNEAKWLLIIWTFSNLAIKGLFK